LGATPAGLEAAPKDSLMLDFLVLATRFSFRVSKIVFACLTVSALSKALRTLIF